ncbi:EI2BG-like protein [Mya arenaria]|uniref:Translation initiation factor eIF2B subunit gamma n=1 Tax=Mya arenaria TaxID=6604 RepID=A0ABY7FLK6_MYAAR|nr:EI2BG-like protein [Mya arenaria]
MRSSATAHASQKDCAVLSFRTVSYTLHQRKAVPVVLAAGRGSRMTDLVSQTSKSLLPVGNKPMLWYPINMLQRAGFEEAIVVVLSSYQAETQKLLEMCGVAMRLDIVSIPDQDYMGTADTLRHIRDKIKRDVLVVSCDLITDVSLHHIANMFRTYDATVTMLLCSQPETPDTPPAPGPKTKKRSERDFIGFEDNGNRVLFMTSEADLADMDDDKIKFRKSLFKKHPNVRIRSNLTDCHLYLIKKWVTNFFNKRRVDTTFDILSYIPEDPMTATIRDMSTWVDHRGDMEDCCHGDKIRCYAYTVTGSLCVRTNTIASYCETNKQIPRYLATLNKGAANIDPSAIVKGKPQRSIIGRNCVIGEKVKISNSVILDRVQIADGCSVQGCIISSNAGLGERCELKDCIVGGAQNLPPDSKFTNEALVAEEEMLEI